MGVGEKQARSPCPSSFPHRSQITPCCCTLLCGMYSSLNSLVNSFSFLFVLASFPCAHTREIGELGFLGFHSVASIGAQ